MPVLSRNAPPLLRKVDGKQHATTVDHEHDDERAPGSSDDDDDDDNDDNDDNDMSALGGYRKRKPTHIRAPKRVTSTANKVLPPAKREADSEDELDKGPFSQSSQTKPPKKTFTRKFGSQNQIARQEEKKAVSFKARDTRPVQPKPPDVPKKAFRAARAPEPSSSQPDTLSAAPGPTFRHPAPVSNFTADSTELSGQSQPMTLDSSQLSPPPPPSSPTTSLFDAEPEHTTDNSVSELNPPCPICGEKIEKDFWDKFQDDICHRRMNLRLQEKFCQAHKARNADDVWNDRGYPKIYWSALQSRLKAHHHHLRAILDGQFESPYYEQHAKMISSAKGYTAAAAAYSGRFTGLRAGYYGSKGEKIIAEHIVRTFSDKLRALSETDPLIASGGVSGGLSGYVHAILVPEMTVELIMQDMTCDRDKARIILADSADMGEMFNEEEDEKARRVEVDLLETSTFDDGGGDVLS